MMLFLFVLCAGVLAAQTPPSGETERFLTTLAQQQLARRVSTVSGIRDRAGVEGRQKYIRERMLAQIGGLFEKTPLRARKTGEFVRSGYRIEKVIFESLPGFFVTANIYVPSGTPPFPAVLGTAGHSTNGKASATYQNGWISLARNGFLVLAYDPPGQGERSEYFDAGTGQSRVGIGTAEHMMAGAQCLLTGTNIARYEIWDGIRAFDYLLTRPDVDPKRISVAGNSGGGTQTAYLMVFEPRLAAAAPSCYITAWSHQWSNPGPQDSEQDFVNFLADGFDFPDFLIAFAPKPLKVLTAIRDFFPIAGARQTFAEAKRIYEVLGAGDRISFFEYDDGHGWSRPRREATVEWFSRWMWNRPSTPESGIVTELDIDLDASASGQVGGETVQSLNHKLAEQLFAKRAALRAKDLGPLAAKRIAIERPSGTPVMERRGTTWMVTSEGDSRIQVEVTGTGAGKRPAVIYVDPAASDLEALRKGEVIVAAPKLRGWEQNGARRSGYSPNWQNAMRALLVGKTLVGLQTVDILRCFDLLASMPEVDASRISILAKGSAGVAALHAAAIEPRIHRVAVEGMVTSYMAIARAKIHRGLEDIIVPGVLKDYDLPDLARALGTARLRIVEPRMPSGARLYPGPAKAEYPGFAIRYRSEAATFEQMYGKWIY